MQTFRSEYIRCGKKCCKSCPHGPYWYGYWKEGKKTRKKYYGKVDPRPAKQEAPGPKDGRWTVRLACECLGLATTATKDEAGSIYRKLTLAHHPDRGGDLATMQRIVGAWDYLTKVACWWG